jgi:hypothetical protein
MKYPTPIDTIQAKRAIYTPPPAPGLVISVLGFGANSMMLGSSQYGLIACMHKIWRKVIMGFIIESW